MPRVDRRKVYGGIFGSEIYKEIYKNDEDLWREFLFNNFGKRSLKEFNQKELITLMKQLHGMKPQSKPKPKIEQITKPQHDEIKVIWATSPAIRVKEFGALAKFIKRIIGKEVHYDLKELTKEEATKIIIALRKIDKS